MNKFDRIQQLHSIFTNRRTPVSLTALMEQMECGEATVKRLIAKFRHEIGVPIVYDRARNGYLLQQGENGRYELPGLWFSVSELHSLFIIHELLDRLQPGMLKAELSAFRRRIEEILSANKADDSELLRRVRFFNMAGRSLLPRHFRDAAGATLLRRRLKIQYHGRSNDSLTNRVVSPQRIIYYRENWYLDCWCHQREALRTFSLDRIRKTELLKDSAKEISDRELDHYFMPTYGLFGGAAAAVAVLHFTSGRARWVADEQWHPDQKSEWRKDGSFILRVPYSDQRELLLDILRYGADVEVLEPEDLRREVKKCLQQALQKYTKE